MIGKFLLDTNIIIAIFAEDQLVERFLTLVYINSMSGTSFIEVQDTILGYLKQLV